MDQTTPTGRTPAGQIAAARDRLTDGVQLAAGDRPDLAVDEIDAALRLLHAARERIVTASVRRQQAMLAQYDALDTYAPNLLAACPPGDHATGMCVLSGCGDHRRAVAS